MISTKFDLTTYDLKYSKKGCKVNAMGHSLPIFLLPMRVLLFIEIPFRIFTVLSYVDSDAQLSTKSSKT